MMRESFTRIGFEDMKLNFYNKLVDIYNKKTGTEFDIKEVIKIISGTEVNFIANFYKNKSHECNL